MAYIESVADDSRRSGLLDRFLSGFLALAVLGGIGLLIFQVANPGSIERFTEFYILDSNGMAIDYPGQITAGEAAEVSVGIVNREQESAVYRLEVSVDGTKTGDLGPIELADGEKWEQPVTFRAEREGQNQKVEFLLFRQGQAEVYRSLHLWVDVVK